MPGILIIGASHSGVAAAAALRSAKYEGDITLVTEETVLPYHRPPLSKDALSKDGYSPTLLRPESFYTNNRIDLRQGSKIVSVNTAENYALSADGVRFPYERLILACGAEPRRLPPQIDPDGVAHYLRTQDDLTTMKAPLAKAKSVAIIGGGLIGMEIAAVALAQGLQVTVIEAGQRLMERTVSKSIAGYVLDRHLNKGLEVRFGAMVTSVMHDDSRNIDIVTLGDGGEIVADIVVVAIGATPHETLAREAGLNVENGILVSECGLTSNPAIFAIGDCSAWYDPDLDRYIRNEAVNPGQDQAKIVASKIVGLEMPPRRLPRYWSHQAAIQIQMSGDVNGADMEAVLNAPASGAFSVLGFNSDCLVAVQTINAPQQFGKLHDMIGMKREEIATVLDVEFPPPHHH
ncbi:NAD(P)H-nitrite reductase [Pararhizobium polonicum]|uniref:NAD(P)H-nitrite reductase n=1 Tax=Pararhizobium polonicum TaxID=1612624 RepID=A0A1C7P7C5_9HYPH|nr:FAD-dependent oxidoreductase [Pararhizobium polonicum]OBZ97162.1 NAD(P)H-nitrite reductase [Pararhizobium polonicum]